MSEAHWPSSRGIHPRSVGDPIRRSAKLFELASGFSVIMLVILLGTDILKIAEVSRSVISIARAAILGGMLLFVLLHFRHFVRGVMVAPEFMALAVLAFASALWSIDRGATLRNAPPLFVTTAFAMTLGSRLPLRQLLLGLAALLAITAFASLAAVAVFPMARGAPPWEGVWSGVFTHKNGLGSTMCSALLFTVPAVYLTRGRTRRAFLAGAALSFFLLAVTESRTSQIIGMISLLSLATLFLARRHVLAWSAAYLTTILMVISGVALAFFTGVSDIFFEAIGRQPTMSDRIPIWQVVWPYVEQRYLLGWGYMAFWDQDSARIISFGYDSRLFFVPFYSHNGLIEMMLNFGIIGTLIFSFRFVRSIFNIFNILKRRPQSLDAAVFLIFLWTVLFQNFPESYIAAEEQMLWMACVALMTKTACIARLAAEENSRPARWAAT